MRRSSAGLLLAFTVAGCGSPARTAGGAPTATPAPAPTIAVTPIPTTAAPPSAPPGSVRTGGITYPITQLKAIQQAVDAGDPRYRYALDPVKVTLHDLPADGFEGPISVVSPSPPEPAPTAHHGEDGLPETDVIVQYRGRRYWIVLNQFLRHGPRGIWSVITITPM